MANRHTVSRGQAPNWYHEISLRKTFTTKGEYDTYYNAPDGTHLRSRVDVTRYFEAHPSERLVAATATQPARVLDAHSDDFKFGSKYPPSAADRQRCRVLERTARRSASSTHRYTSEDSAVWCLGTGVSTGVGRVSYVGRMWSVFWGALSLSRERE